MPWKSFWSQEFTEKMPLNFWMIVRGKIEMWSPNTIPDTYTNDSKSDPFVLHNPPSHSDAYTQLYSPGAGTLQYTMHPKYSHQPPDLTPLLVHSATLQRGTEIPLQIHAVGSNSPLLIVAL